MPNKEHKQRASFSLDPIVMKMLKKMAYESDQGKSSIVEQAIKAFYNEQHNKKNK